MGVVRLVGESSRMVKIVPKILLFALGIVFCLVDYW